jgi:type II secretion system protein N
MKARRLYAFLGYAAFALMALMLWAYVTFPMDAVGQRLSHEVSERSGNTISLVFDKLSFYGISGIRASNVEVRTTLPGKDAAIFRFDVVSARLRLLPLLWLSLSVDSELQLGEGRLAVSVAERGGVWNGAIMAQKFQLGAGDLAKAWFGLSVQGVLDGEAEVSVHSDPKQSTGQATIVIAQAMIGPGVVQGLTVPQIELGDISVSLAMDKGRLVIDSFRQTGGQLHARVSAQSVLQRSWATSSLDGCLGIRAAEELLRDDAKMQAAFRLAEVQFHKDSDGFLTVPVTGTWQAPRVRSGPCSVR